MIANGPAAAPPSPVFDSRAVRFWCRALFGAYFAFFAARAVRGYWPHFDDVSMYWAAGRLVLTGKAAAVYDWDQIRALQPFASIAYKFYYPPIFLPLLAPLGLLPLPLAAAVWIAATLGVYLAGIRAIVPGLTAALAALAAPAAISNLISGQSGLLLAGLLGGALILLDRRPVAAGVLIGLCAFKPQFGVLLPLFLALTGRWRLFAAAGLTVGGLAAFALLLFGWAPFAASIAFVQQRGPLGGEVDWTQVMSLYGALRLYGIGAGAAWTAHVAVAVAAAAACLWIAAGKASDALKAAGLLTASFVVTPYSEFNDLTILVAACAFVLRDGLAAGWPRWQQAALAIAYPLPFLFSISHFALDLLIPGGSVTGPLPWPAGPAMCGILAAIIGSRALGVDHPSRLGAAAR